MSSVISNELPHAPLYAHPYFGGLGSRTLTFYISHFDTALLFKCSIIPRSQLLRAEATSSVSSVSMTALNLKSEDDGITKH